MNQRSTTVVDVVYELPGEDEYEKAVNALPMFATLTIMLLGERHGWRENDFLNTEFELECPCFSMRQADGIQATETCCKDS
jgi:hypothetical protein